MTSPGTLWRTVRHLKPSQVTGRIARRIVRPRLPDRPVPPRAAVTGPWHPPARREPSFRSPATFDLLGECHALDAVGWEGPGPARLWRYNQHYFDDLNARGASSRANAHRRLVERWLAENPPTRGTGWEPYPTSLRIVNWIRWSLSGQPLPESAAASLAAQARWLALNIETHLLGNHLFANAKALVHAGLFFEGDEADAWLATGRAILEREIPEQILTDGGQFERSPMYHALAVEDMLDLLDVIGALGNGRTGGLASTVAARVPAMLRFLRAMTFPDSRLARFNDSADGVAPANEELYRLASELSLDASTPGDIHGVLCLQPSGYVRVERAGMTAILDVAPVGPDYLPGHAHADTLSFEAAIDARLVVVNGGTSCYGEGARRQHERGTRAHSTVEVAGTDSSEVWAGFRIGRRARVAALSVDARNATIACSHDGYRHLPGHPVHERRWRFDTGAMTVTDTVLPGRHPAVARYHLAPGTELAATSPDTWSIRGPDLPVVRVEITAGRGRAEPSSHAPRFGRVESTVCLAVDLVDGQAETRWTWAR